MKNFKSRYFEDYSIGETIKHSVPRTVTEGDTSIYLSTTGSRFALNYSKEFAKDIGFKSMPIDDILLFHIVFGRTVPDLSLNAIANLGYAGVNFLQSVFMGDTLTAESKIIGLKGVPCSIFNKELVVSGAQPKENFIQIIDSFNTNE